VVLASEVGVLEMDQSRVIRKGRLQPGRMFLVDTEAGRVIEDDEIKGQLAAEHPYQEWLDKGVVHLEELPEAEAGTAEPAPLSQRQQAFGYRSEEHTSELQSRENLVCRL